MAVRCPFCGNLVETPRVQVRSLTGIAIGLLLAILGIFFLIGALVANAEVQQRAISENAERAWSLVYFLAAMGILCLLVVFPVLVWSSSRTENDGPGHQGTGDPSAPPAGLNEPGEPLSFER